jgi:Flp pilus assembly protein TadG
MRRNRIMKDASGAAAVEFAFAMPILLFFLVLLFEGGRMYWMKNSLQMAADEAGRYVMMNPSAANEDIIAAMEENIIALDTSALSVSVLSDTSGPVEFKTLTLSLPFSNLFGSFSSTSGTITAQSIVPAIP